MNLGTWWTDHDEAVIAAVIALLAAFIVAQLVDRALSRRAERLTAGVLRGHVSRETATRIRFVRRAVYAVILLIGLAVALSQFEGVNRIAASLLASGVVAAAIIGFAARQTLANVVAGVMLAVTQPLRVGDWVKVEDHYGVVEDVRLHYTVLRTAGEQRLLIPNEKLASSVLQNDTLVIDTVGVEVAVWIPPGADTARAAEVLSLRGRRVGRRDRAVGRAPRGRRRRRGPAGPRGARGRAARALPRQTAGSRSPGGFRGP